MVGSLFGITFLITLSIYGGFIRGDSALNFNRRGVGMNLVFANSDRSANTDFLHPLLPPECLNGTFCENVENYPTDLFYDVLNSKDISSRYMKYFRKEKLPEKITSRDQKNSTYFLCPSTATVVYPKAAYNLDNNLRFIYNLPGYIQTVSVEVCAQESVSCPFYDSIPNFITKCQQKFGHKLLLTADSEGRPFVDVYSFPTACDCAYRKIQKVTPFRPHLDPKSRNRRERN